MTERRMTVRITPHTKREYEAMQLLMKLSALAEVELVEPIEPASQAPALRYESLRARISSYGGCVHCGTPETQHLCPHT